MYILFTGAPGSRWSGVIQNIYWSKDIDQTDSNQSRQYESGVVKHSGAYFDPGMEFENNLENWDKPFYGMGQRIIRSHTFAHQLDNLKTLKYPIVMVYRNDFECIEWWRQAGGFDISYPNYDYYKDLDTMWSHIQSQNKDIIRFIKENKNNVVTVDNNFELCNTLNIAVPKDCRVQNYSKQDTRVYVYKG